MEREHEAGRIAEDDRSEAVAHSAGLEPGAERNSAPPAGRLAPQPDKGLPFAEALDDAMREHRTVFAALAA